MTVQLEDSVSNGALLPSLADDAHRHFGSRDLSNFVIIVGSGADKIHFHVHWEILACASPYFEKMKVIAMKESRLGEVVLPEDCPFAWNALIWRLYPPLEELTINEAVLVVPLVDRLDLAWLVKELKRVLSDQKSSNSRTPDFADVLCSHGFGEVVSVWFSKSPDSSAWATTAARSFVESCKHADAVRFAASFLLDSVRVSVHSFSNVSYERCSDCRQSCIKISPLDRFGLRP